MKRYIIVSLILFVIVGGITSCKQEEYVHVGSNWDALHKLKAPENTFNVRVSGVKKAKLGDDLSFKVTSDKSGKLWIVQADPGDELTILFPNEKMHDNTISAGKSVQVPPKDADWSIEASEPAGKSIVAFVVTTGDINIADVLSGEKDMSKALRIVDKSDEWGIEKMVVDIK